MNRTDRAGTRRRVITAVAGIAALLIAGRVAADNLAGPEPAPPAATLPSDGPETGPRVMGAIPRAQPTGLTLLVPGWLLDIDAGESYPVAVDGWLLRPGNDPLLVEWEGDADDLGPIEVSSRVDPALPGSPMVTRLNRSAAGTVAANADGDGLWAMEGESGRCTLREVDLTGQQRRPPHAVTCSLRLVAETALGLWVVEEEGWGQTVLLDPDGLGERARYDEAWVVDDYRFVRHPPPWTAFVLHDLRPGAEDGSEAAIAWPDDSASTRVGPLSPDGRYLPLSHVDDEAQTVTVWIAAVDRDGRVVLIQDGPEEPEPRLKVTHVEWARDGRMVMLASVADTGYVVTWDRDNGYQAVPFEHPSSVEFEWPEPEPEPPLAYPILVLRP